MEETQKEKCTKESVQINGVWMSDTKVQEISTECIYSTKLINFHQNHVTSFPFLYMSIYNEIFNCCMELIYDG